MTRLFDLFVSTMYVQDLWRKPHTINENEFKIKITLYCLTRMFELKRQFSNGMMGCITPKQDDSDILNYRLSLCSFASTLKPVSSSISSWILQNI